MPCFSSGSVAFLSLWLLRILFPELLVTQGSVLDAGYRDPEGTMDSVIVSDTDRQNKAEL